MESREIKLRNGAFLRDAAGLNEFESCFVSERMGQDGHRYIEFYMGGAGYNDTVKVRDDGAIFGDGAYTDGELLLMLSEEEPSYQVWRKYEVSVDGVVWARDKVEALQDVMEYPLDYDFAVKEYEEK